MALTVPVARGEHGPISGPVLCEWRPNSRVATLAHWPIAITSPSRRPISTDPAARLTVRDHAGAPAVAIAREAWRFADPTHVALDGGFEPGKIYELVYRAENPPLVGLGLLAVRDAAAWLRSAPAGAGNPCAGELERAYVIGVSQTGRFLRHLLYLGLNEDEAGRKVFDGVFVHIAGGRRGEFNQRFGQPSLNATASVGSLFPFTDTPAVDPVHRRARRAARAARSAWNAAEDRRGQHRRPSTGAATPRSCTPTSRAPVTWRPHRETRVYLFAGCQHTPGTRAAARRRPQHGLARPAARSTSSTTRRSCAPRS